jgi:hypothetical protein
VEREQLIKVMREAILQVHLETIHQQVEEEQLVLERVQLLHHQMGVMVGQRFLVLLLEVQYLERVEAVEP